MKKIIALIIASVMMLGAAQTTFAQTATKDFSYNVVVNGEKMSRGANEAINVDGSTMFIPAYYVRFSEAGLTEQSVISSGKAFVFEGRNYYSLRDVANKNGLNVYWDSATNTAIVVNKDKYEQIKSYIDASNKQSADMKKVDMDMSANINIDVTASGLNQKMSLPMSATIKMDLETPFIEAIMSMNVEGQEIKTHMYDDGKQSYTLNPLNNEWTKTDSTLAEAVNIVEQIKQMNPAVSALAEDLSYAGLKMTKSGEDTVLEGDMYVAESFNDIDLDGMVSELLGTMGAEGVEVHYNMPKTMYVKYVFDKNGDMTAMDMKFNMSLDMDIEGTSASFIMDLDLKVPKIIINGEINTVVPEDIVKSATEASALPTAEAE